MKLPISTLLGLLVLALAFCVPASKAQAQETPGKVETITLTSTTDAQKVQTAISASLRGRRWTITEENAGKIVGFYKNKGHEAEITLVFDEKHIDIFCTGYTLNRDGTRKSAETPMGWVRNLSKDIHTRLGMAFEKSKS